MVTWRHTSHCSMNLSDLEAKRFLGVKSMVLKRMFAAYNCFAFPVSDELKRKHDNVNALVRFVREPIVGRVKLIVFQRWSQVVNYFFSKAEQVVRSVSTGALLTMGKTVISLRVTGCNQTVDIFLFSEFILKIQLPRKSKNVKHLVFYFHFLDQIQGINIFGRFSSASLHKPFGFIFVIFITIICLNQTNLTPTNLLLLNLVSG